MKKYEILGGNLPVVVCELSAGERMERMQWIRHSI